jgi:CAAX protease family protein
MVEADSMIMVQNPTPRRIEALVQRYPVSVYVMLTYAISFTGALIIAAPYLLRNASIPKFTGLKMFPIMLLGPVVASIVLTWIGDGKSGIKNLISRIRKVRFSGRWYVTLLIPPTLVLTVLMGLKILVSPIYAPNNFLIGIMFGLVAGFFEEIGWMGYAFPKLCLKHNAFVSGLLVGLIWGAWHFPVIDHLGTATPHGSFWIPYFLSFIAAMTAMRVLIAWIYTNTKSILLAQFMHASSTGSLVIFSPPHATAAQETLWYAVYACVLWVAVASIVAKSGVHLTRQRPEANHAASRV